MNFKDYQKQAVKTAIYSPAVDTVYPALGLASEAGEVAGKVKKYMRDGGSYIMLRDQLLDELGDVLWYVAAIARDLDIELEEIAEHNIKKLKDRQSRGVISGSGDYR